MERDVLPVIALESKIYVLLPVERGVLNCLLRNIILCTLAYGEVYACVERKIFSMSDLKNAKITSYMVYRLVALTKNSTDNGCHQKEKSGPDSGLQSGELEKRSNLCLAAYVVSRSVLANTKSSFALVLAKGGSIGTARV